MLTPISGIHHITGIAGDPQRNLDFYTVTLGLRMVKRTVNFDDPGTYHFYFGDYEGNPGTILTFFPWPDARRGRRGQGQVADVAFGVPSGTLGAWQERLTRLGVTTATPFRRFDEEVLRLLDPDGLSLELVAREALDAVPGWEGGPVPAEMAVRGFAAPTLLLQNLEPTAALLGDLFGMQPSQQDGTRHRFTSGGGIGQQVDIELRPSEVMGRGGAGTIHHIAWRAENDEQQAAYRELLVGHGYEVTPVLDRQYFHSIYFREPGGILFEIATDPPGFTLDEPLESLGSALRLPPWYEPRRGEIERILPPLTINQPETPRGGSSAS